MKFSLARRMARAAELTRSGKLVEATSFIRSLIFNTVNTAEKRSKHQLGGATLSERKVHRSLSGSFGGIVSGRKQWRKPLIPTPLHLPVGAQFQSLTHTGANGSRDYLLYIPAKKPAGLMPLIVMMHGCSQSPEDFATGTGMNGLAEQFGYLIAWPAQHKGANFQKCWNWFRPQDQGRENGEPALVAGIVEDIVTGYRADPKRVYAAGLSAGGAAAAILGSAYPEIFAAIGVHSGLPVGGAKDMMSAIAAMRSGSTGLAVLMQVPTIVFHGMADATVHPSNGKAVVGQALQARSGLDKVQRSGVSAGGRKFRQTRHDDPAGRSMTEHWEIDGAGHAWAGGKAEGSYTDPKGPDASAEMIRFFLQHAKGE